MTTHSTHNFSGREPEARDGDSFDGCNFAQATPGTKLFEGRRGLTFRHCNLARAIVPGDSAIEDCNVTQRAIPISPEEEPEITLRVREYDRLKALDVREPRRG